MAFQDNQDDFLKEYLGGGQGTTKMRIVQGILVTISMVLFLTNCKFSCKLEFNYFLENFPQWPSSNESVPTFKCANYLSVIAEN